MVNVCSSLRPRVWVEIFNKANDHRDLTIHCWSKDDDLHFHVLKYDQMYQFTFRPNIWGTTKFHCDVVFGDGFRRRYMAYKFGRDKGCRHCVWHLNENQACKLSRGDWICIDYTE
uniref:S-protein homolog n=1 Tax=Kalanchoe fedtschenkoi TaxID=63787 RepID=A0A7N0VMR8_KALFE